MNCPSCRKSIPDDAIFCNYCGSRIAEGGNLDAVQPSVADEATTRNTPPAPPSPPAQQASDQVYDVQPVPSQPSTPSPAQAETNASEADPPSSPSQSFTPVPPVAYTNAMDQDQALPAYSPVPEPYHTGEVPVHTAYPEMPSSVNPYGSSQSLPTYPPYAAPQFPVATDPYSQPLPAPPAQPAAMALPAAPNWQQLVLIRVFQPALASNPWLGIILGGVLATLLGVLAFLLLVPIIHGLLPIKEAAANDYLFSVLFNVTPLQNTFRDALQLFLTAQGVSTHLQYTYGSSGALSVNTSTSPLNGLLCIPALFLVFGGYIAACTDFRDRPLSSLWRGAAVALPYTFLLFVLSTQVNGNVASPGSPGYVGTLNMDVLTLILFGLLWGALFGLLGASLKLGRGQWRHLLHTFLLTNRRPQLMGALAGGIFSTVLGFSLALLIFACLLAFTTLSIPFLNVALYCSVPNTGGWQNLTFWGISQAPFHAVLLLAFSFGAPVTLSNTGANAVCFYSNSAQATVALPGGNIHLYPWVYCILLLPIISLFIGGRVSVAIARVRGAGPAAIQGALIAVPFTILMMILVAMSTLSSTSTFSNASGTSAQLATQSTGINVLDVLLWALLSGALLGALGGIYQASSARAIGHQVGAALAMPLLTILTPIFKLFDFLTRRPSTARRSAAHNFLYGAVVAAILLTVVAGFVGLQFILLDKVISVDGSQRIRDIVSVVLIGLPGLLLISAGFVALSKDPVAPQPGTIAPQAQGGII